MLMCGGVYIDIYKSKGVFSSGGTGKAKESQGRLWGHWRKSDGDARRDIGEWEWILNL